MTAGTRFSLEAAAPFVPDSRTRDSNASVEMGAYMRHRRHEGERNNPPEPSTSSAIERAQSEKLIAILRSEVFGCFRWKVRIRMRWMSIHQARKF